MIEVGVSEAKTRLSALLGEVARGEEVSITPPRRPGGSPRSRRTVGAGANRERDCGAARPSQETAVERAGLEGAAGRRPSVTGFVVDCSIAVSWLLEDEATPEPTRSSTDCGTTARMRRASGAWNWATHWRKPNGGSVFRPRGVAAYLDIVDRLPIITDMETESRAFREILALARRLGLTTYDAAYLELAMRREAELATLDKALIRAARRVSVSVLP